MRLVGKKDLPSVKHFAGRPKHIVLVKCQSVLSDYRCIRATLGNRKACNLKAEMIPGTMKKVIAVFCH